MEINFDEVRRLVKEGFITARKHPTESLWIYNYTPKAQFEKMWTSETMQCRGLITDDGDRIIARPFSKFFNLEELDGKIPLESFKVFEKADGSLGILYWIGDDPFIATRGSFESGQAQRANKILRRKYASSFSILDKRVTYLWEIVYPENRIVVDYGATEDLFFLAAFNTETGAEHDYEDVWLNQLGGLWPRVRRYDGVRDLSEIRKFENDRDEGFVVRFESGLRVKIKFAEYMRLHKLLTQVSTKSIWESLRAGKPLNEILERVPDEFYKWVKRIKTDLEQRYATVEALAKAEFRDLGDRKENALYYTKMCNSSPSILFNMLDGKNYDQIIWKMLRPKFEKPFREDVG